MDTHPKATPALQQARAALERWLDKFIPADLKGDLDGLRRSRMLTGSALVVGPLTLGLASVRFGLEGLSSPIGIALALAGLTMLMTIPVLRATRSTAVAGWLVPSSGAAAVVMFALFEGGLHSEAIFWFPLVPLIAGLFVDGRRAAGLMTVLLSATVALLLGLQAKGQISLNPQPEEVILALKGVSVLAGVIFGGAVAWLYEQYRRKAEQALRRSRDQLETMIEALPDLIYRISPSGLILEAHVPPTAAASGALWFSEPEPADRDIKDLLPDGEASVLMENLEALGESGGIRTWIHERATPQKVYLFEIRLVQGGDGEALAIVRDVTKEQNFLRLKDDFVSIVNHELRTPLTAIHGSLRLITGGVVADVPPRLASMLDLAHRNSKRLLSLVDEILDLQKLEAGHMDFSFETIEVAPFLTHAVSMSEGYAEQYGVSLVTNVAHDLEAWVSVDEGRLMQVMSNLLSNAIKYSPKGAQVEVRGMLQGEGIRIEVEDRGDGIPEEFRERVFEKFAQAADANTRRVGGTGLGLAISERIVHRLGGTIGFETESGEGTTFHVELPSARLELSSG